MLTYFDCTTDLYCSSDPAGDPMLRADLVLSCSGSRYLSFVPYAVLMTLVYPIGIPLSYILLLRRYAVHFHPRHRWMRPILRDACGCGGRGRTRAGQTWSGLGHRKRRPTLTHSRPPPLSTPA